jgi:hypothetical protein
MRTSLSLSVVLFVACASGRQIYLPDGTRGRMVSCSGGGRDWGDCMNRAHQICGGRYRIVERYDERTGGELAASDAGTRSWSNAVDRKMLVTCTQ